MAGLEVALRLTGMGWYVVVAVIGGTVGGRALDNWLNTGPGLTIAGLLLGLLVAGFGIGRMISPILASSANSSGARDGRDEDQELQ
jgi:F0F1-type ATP synthase assembly protein I